MIYISGQKALNLSCDLETCGDWHTSSMNWKILDLKESENSFFGDYGIEQNKAVPEQEELYNIANHIRALLDLLIEGNFPLTQGMNNDFICNEKYNDEIFSKVYLLKNSKNWEDIDLFMGSEYKMKWINYKRGVENGRLEKRS